MFNNIRFNVFFVGFLTLLKQALRKLTPAMLAYSAHRRSHFACRIDSAASNISDRIAVVFSDRHRAAMANCRKSLVSLSFEEFGVHDSVSFTVLALPCAAAYVSYIGRNEGGVNRKFDCFGSLHKTISARQHIRMIEILLIPALSLLNRAAGWNAVEDYQKKHGLDTYEQAWAKCPAWMRVAKYATDKFVCAAYAGLIVSCWDWKLGIVTALGFAIWRLFGWGAIFHAFNGRSYVGTGKLSRFVGKFLGDYAEAASTVYGCIRGFLGMLPFAAGLAMLGHFGAGLALLVVGACMGVVYWLGGIHQRLTGKDTGIKISEALMGALLGACIAGAL